MSTVSDATSGSSAPAVPGGGPRRATRGRPARYTPDDLLEVVVTVFNQRGYEAASMEDLARASGLTKSAFYHHFTGKEQLLRLALDRALDALAGVVDHPGVPGGRNASPLATLQYVIRRTAEILVDELPYVTLLLRVRGNTDVEREALARRRTIDAGLAELVREAADAGHIRGDIDPKLVSRLLFGMVNSISEWYRPKSRSTSKRELADAVVELALKGLDARQG